MKKILFNLLVILSICSLVYAHQPLECFEEEDGDPSVCTYLMKLPNTTITENADGSISYVPVAGGGSGDEVTVNGTAVDTTANFKDNAEVTFTHTDGGAGGPDDVKGVIGAIAATKISIVDSGSYYIGAEVETALQEVGVIIPIIYDPTIINFGDVNQEYDLDAETWVTSTAGIPDAAGHLLPATLVTIATPYDASFLAVRELTGAASATNPLTVQFTWESVVSFSTVKMRVEYDGSFSHTMVFELWNGGTWDTFITISGTAAMEVYTAEILVPATYIIGGDVVGRFRHEQSGVATHHLEVDYIIISSGGGGGGGALQTAIQTVSTATGDVAATNVQDAIAELDTEKEPHLVNSAGLLGALDDETGTGLAVFNISPQFETSILGNYLTASELLGTDGSKNIVSLPVATYPSLAEFAFGKGVTSAIQGQIDGKEAALTTLAALSTALSNQAEVMVSFTITNGDTAIDASVVDPIACTGRIPNNMKITAWYLDCDKSGSIAIDVWKNTWNDTPLVVGDSIAGTEDPTLVADVSASDTSLTSMTADWDAGDEVCIAITSAATVTKCTLNFEGYYD